MEEQFPVPQNIATSEIGNGIVSLLRQLRCHYNPNHNKFSSLSNTTVVAIFLTLCLWRRSLCSNLEGIDPEKLYWATLPGLAWDCKRNNNKIKSKIREFAPCIVWSSGNHGLWTRSMWLAARSKRLKIAGRITRVEGDKGLNLCKVFI